MCFCPICSQCPQCCRWTDCRGTVTTVVAYLARNGCESSGGLCTEGRLFPPLQSETSLDKISFDSQWLRKSYQKPFPQRGFAKSGKGKLVVEKVVIKSSLAFYNQLFLVPKPNRKWRPMLYLNQLNLYLKTSSFKMVSPETIRLSLQTGEWVTSLDFSDAYFHIPINQRSRKYLRFFLNNQTFQFTALPFGLATAPLEFTKVVKEVKLMAQARGVRIHQYLDDWLLRAQCRETCLQHTQILLALCQQLGWVVNIKKSDLEPQQIFNFGGYRFDLVSGQVLPTQDRWIALQEKLNFIKNRSSCTVRQFMSLIGLLTATENQVLSGRLHMRPIQWHLNVTGMFLRF